MKRRRIFFFIAVIAATVAVMATLRREPTYRGRSLTSWLDQCDKTPLDEAERLAEAQRAVRAMPIEKVLPQLMRLVESKDGPVRQWVGARLEDLPLRLRNWHLPEARQQLGISGFEALQTNAGPAVEPLRKLLNDKERAFTAARALAGIGKPAEHALCQALTNHESRVRHLAISALASVTDDVEVYLDRLTNCLYDLDPSVRFAAVQSVGAQLEAPARAITLLVASLRDADRSVAAQAVAALKGFGTNAAAAFPVLTNLVQNGSSGDPAHGALKALVAIDPNLALPIVLATFESSDQPARVTAFSLMIEYPVETDRIRAVIQDAVADRDPLIARRAKELLTEQYLKAHPEEFAFQNEPTYRGKSLAGWLRMRDGDGDLSAAAKAAIHEMGTNAIPALLERLVYRRPPFGFRAYQINLDAARGFMALGDRAKPALPQLEILMNSPDEDTAQFSMLATLETGADAIPCLVKGLTNPFQEIRSQAASDLGDFFSRFPREVKAAIPALVNLLGDTNENVRINASNALREIDPQTAAQFGIK